MAQHLRSGATIALATKLDQVGQGAGFLLVGKDFTLHLEDSKPEVFDARFLFVIEKPIQKSGGNPDQSRIYDGDDILLRSVGNGRYPRFTSNYGGTNVWEMIATEHEAKSNYRSEGQGSMEMYRIVSMDREGQQPGAPVLMDGQHSYGFVNVRSVAWLSASKEGVRSSANAGPRESWFITDHQGQVPRSNCTGSLAPTSGTSSFPPTVYQPGVSSLAMSSTTESKMLWWIVAIISVVVILGGLGLFIYWGEKDNKRQ